ncbi:MAG: hypothetical protein WC335_03885 [Candidatus Omnitrophota bacterium]|jgi:hypothetical protein
MNNLAGKLIVVLAVTVFYTAFGNSGLQAAGGAAYTRLPQKEESVAIMEVNFYKIDREKANKGEFVGTVILKDAGLEIKVIDPDREKLLKEPFKTIVSEKKDNKIYTRRVTCQPGTKEHRESFAVECYKFGYIGELVKK